MDVGKKKKPGSRLFQLALNDAFQSHLSRVSPVRILMEKEKMEKRKNKCIKSKMAIQRTDVPEKKSSSVSFDKFAPKIGKKTKNSNTANGLKNENLSECSSSTKICKVKDIFTSNSDYKNDFSTKNRRDMSPTGITWKLGDQKSGEEVCSPKPRRSSLLNDFECLWIPEENDSSSGISGKSISIDLNSPEWDKIESKCVSSSDSNSEISIDYDLPVFPLGVVSERIPTQEPLQKSFGDVSEMSNLTLGSSEFAFPTLETPALEFLQQSVVLNNFIPPPRVMSMKQSYADHKEIPAPHVHDTISRSCKSLNSPKCIGENLRAYGSEARLSDVNNEKSPKFNQYLTFRHFKSMFPENHYESFQNAVERNVTGNYPLNYSHMDCPISKPHSDNKMSGGSLEQPYKSHPNFNYIKTSCYGNPSGLLEHFPEFKPVM